MQNKNAATALALYFQFSATHNERMVPRIIPKFQFKIELLNAIAK